MNGSPDVEDKNEKRDKLYGRISFWSAMILTTLLCYGYYDANPPDVGAVKRMRLFFAENAREVSQFLRLPHQEQKEFAAEKKHPFYRDFVRASEVAKVKIRALAHKSVDYKPVQYGINLAFIWAIFFAAFWFLGLMTQAVIQLSRRKK